MSDQNEQVKLQQELTALKDRIARIEEDTGSVVMIQGRLLSSLNDLQTSVLKLRESIIRIKDRLG